MTLLELIKDGLNRHGFDGFINNDGCACHKDDLCPCDMEGITDCRPAKLKKITDCGDDECEFKFQEHYHDVKT